MSQSLIQKSTIKKIKEPDFSQKVVITSLHADKATVEWHFNQMKQALGDKAKDEEIWQRIDVLVLKDNVFNKAMQIIVPCFEIKVDEDDLKNVMERVKQTNKAIADAGENVLRAFSSRLIEKRMIFDQLAKDWKVEVSDDEVKKMLENYYKLTNQPIREFMDNPEILASIKDNLFEQKMAEVICSKLKWKPDWEAIKKAAAAANPNNKEQK